MEELWTQFKEIFIDIVKYGFTTIAIVLSAVSFFDSRKTKEIQGRLTEIEAKLKKYELEEKEKEREEASKACVEVRIYNISRGKYRMKVWNSRKSTAYNVDFIVPEECKGMVWRDKVPFEFLEPGKRFEEIVLVYSSTPDKFTVTTTWTDKNGSPHIKEQMVTV